MGHTPIQRQDRAIQRVIVRRSRALVGLRITAGVHGETGRASARWEQFEAILLLV